MPRACDSRMRLAVCVALWLGCLLAPLPAFGDEPAAETKDAAVSFQRDVLPILRTSCQGCHQAAQPKGGVDLTSRAGIFGESESGAVVVTPGNVEASELLAQITPDASGEALMPKEGAPLSREQIDVIRRWIVAGAEYTEIERPHFDAEHP